LQGSKRVLKDIISAAANDVLLLSSSLHDLKPLLVNTLEFLAHGWHLLGDITRCEHRYKVGPEVLNLKPFFNDIVDITK